MIRLWPTLIYALLALAIHISHAMAVTLGPTYVGPGLNGDKERAAKYLEAVAQVQAVVNSPEFKNEVLLKSFTSTRKSPADVLLDMEKASEILSPGDNGIWEWEFAFYYKKRTKVIGWTNAATKTVWLNRAKFDYMELAEIADNVAHEYMHKIRYDHSSASDLRSVPYAIGYLVESMVRARMAPVPPPVLSEPQPQQTQPRKSWWQRLKSILSPWS